MAEKKRYRFRVGCSECATLRSGCFNGSYMESLETYETPEEAHEAGMKAASVAEPWYHYLIDETGQEVDYPLSPNDA